LGSRISFSNLPSGRSIDGLLGENGIRRYRSVCKLLLGTRTTSQLLPMEQLTTARVPLTGAVRVHADGGIRALENQGFLLEGVSSGGLAGV
jgi:hypothetical protein